eukprot:3245416-Amphidinium_carterae.2
MRLQTLEEQVSALMDGPPSARQPEAAAEVLVRSKQKMRDRDKACSSSPHIPSASWTWGSGTSGMGRPSSLPPETTGERPMRARA